MTNKILKSETVRPPDLMKSAHYVTIDVAKNAHICVTAFTGKILQFQSQQSEILLLTAILWVFLLRAAFLSNVCVYSCCTR
jgi:hypothetical protein